MSNKQLSMSVQEFVTSALEQIHEGLVGKEIAGNVIDIAFEIGIDITQSSEKKTKGGLGLSVASVINLDTLGQSGNHTGNKTYNKLSFSIPLRLRQNHSNEVVTSLKDIRHLLKNKNLIDKF